MAQKDYTKAQAQIEQMQAQLAKMVGDHIVPDKAMFGSAANVCTTFLKMNAVTITTLFSVEEKSTKSDNAVVVTAWFSCWCTDVYTAFLKANTITTMIWSSLTFRIGTKKNKSDVIQCGFCAGVGNVANDNGVVHEIDALVDNTCRMRDFIFKCFGKDLESHYGGVGIRGDERIYLANVLGADITIIYMSKR
ncbi:hypothetical protein SELMODRAFT_424711 [Selaginella moellendorffii]|uniref:Uncharacterized protein n=1 Tax=Selaginella moellendorffii TaxID=88036 RepID=D8SQT8_SELML|nr:hypothetical protein SELMODRAFT_424711 [Selaginella moellendorffii]